jgi:peptidoglycan/xylan/chitin deacetylase (PgdA/CDA1 family)
LGNGLIVVLLIFVVLGKLSLWLLGPILLAHAVLMLMAGLCPQAQLCARVIWQGRAGRSAVSLTFDDGPDPDTTPRILELLRAQQHTATFFVIGEKVERHPELVRRIVAEGHALGLHSYDHDRLYALKSPEAVAGDVERTQRVIREATGITPTWLRPPIGQVSPNTGNGATAARVKLVAWSARGLDGVKGQQPARVAQRIIRQLRDGAVIMMHDAAERGNFVPASLEALPLVQAAIRERGLRVVPLGELCELD